MERKSGLFQNYQATRWLPSVRYLKAAFGALGVALVLFAIGFVRLPEDKPDPSFILPDTADYYERISITLKVKEDGTVDMEQDLNCYMDPSATRTGVAIRLSPNAGARAHNFEGKRAVGVEFKPQKIESFKRLDESWMIGVSEPAQPQLKASAEVPPKGLQLYRVAYQLAPSIESDKATAINHLRIPILYRPKLKIRSFGFRLGIAPALRFVKVALVIRHEGGVSTTSDLEPLSDGTETHVSFENDSALSGNEEVELALEWPGARPN